MLSRFFEEGDPEEYLSDTNLEFWIKLSDQEVPVSEFDSGYEMPHGSLNLSEYMSSCFDDDDATLLSEQLVRDIKGFSQQFTISDDYSNLSIELGVLDRMSSGEPDEYEDYKTIDF